MQPPGQKPAAHVRAGAGGAADANGDAPHLACAGAHGGEIAIAVGADVSPVAPTTPEARPCSAARSVHRQHLCMEPWYIVCHKSVVSSD